MSAPVAGKSTVVHGHFKVKLALRVFGASSAFVLQFTIVHAITAFVLNLWQKFW